MGYFIVLAISWIGSLISKGKGIICTFIAFLWMAYLGGTASPTTTTDYISYQYYYNLLLNGLPGNRLEWLYTYLSKVAIYYGFDYASFRLFLIYATFIILFIAVIRLTEKPILFSALFLIFPFFNEVTQVRSFVAYTLVLFGLTFLKKLSFKNILIFEVIVWLGMGFHSSASVFLFIPLVQIFVQKAGITKASYLSTILTFSFALLLMISSKIGTLINFMARILELVGGSFIATTFTNLMNHSSNRKIFFVIALISYVSYQWYLAKVGNECSTNNSSFRVPYSLYALLLMGELLLPLLLISDQLQRFQRIGIESGLLIASTLFYEKVKTKKSGRYLFILIVVVLILISMFLYYGLTDINADFPKSIPYIGHFIKE